MSDPEFLDMKRGIRLSTTEVAEVTAPAVLLKRSKLYITAADHPNAGYGPTCTGTDDQEELSEAIAELPTGGGVIELSNGTFNFSASPDFANTDNVHIIGQGDGERSNVPVTATTAIGTRIQAAADFSGTAILHIYHTGGSRPLANIRIQDLSVDGGGIGSNVHGIYFSGHRGRIVGVNAHYCTGDGIRIQGVSGWNTYDTFISMVRTHHNSAIGLHMAEYAPDLQISQVISFQNQDGIVVDENAGSQQMVLIHAYNNTRYGVHFNSGGSRTKIVNLKCENSGQHGLIVSGATSGIVDLQVDTANFKGNSADTANTYDHIHLTGSGTSNHQGFVFNNITFGWISGNAARYGIFTDSRIYNARFANVLPFASAYATSLTNYNGIRQTINGWGRNVGDPTSTGDWNGNGEEGINVRDTSGGGMYAYLGGAWRALA